MALDPELSLEELLSPQENPTRLLPAFASQENSTGLTPAFASQENSIRLTPTCLSYLSEAWLSCLAVGGYSWIKEGLPDCLEDALMKQSVTRESATYLTQDREDIKAILMPCFPGSSDLAYSQRNLS